jgi:epidermal growth factor receptor substrate 15
VFAYLFNLADTDQLGVVTGERAVPFFERTTLNPQVLGEIWQIADTENRGLLTRPGFCIVLRLIGHYQAGREPTTELAFQQGPIPKFDGISIPSAAQTPASPSQSAAPTGALQPQLSGQPPIRVPPLDPQKVQQYSGLFEKSGAQNGQLDAGTAKAIFEKSGLPNEVLGRIWMLSDREQTGALDQTEFIVAMHLLTSMKTRSMTALPNTLPAAFYQAAARRGAPPPPGNRSVPGAAGIPRQFSGGSVAGPARTQSPLARPPTYGTPPPMAPPMSTQTTGPQWLITPQEKSKYDQFFNTVDTQRRGVVTGEQAVRFFSDSGLPEDTLASVWDLADINSEGQLTKDEFAVAMYLIRQQRMPNAAPLPAFLPPALVPPTLRKQNLQQQTEQTTAPAFDNANNTSNLPKSAADDLFGLDEMSAPQVTQPVLQPQSTGASISRDPFSSSMPTSPSSPQRFQPAPQQANSHFKPFMPTSAFGASLAHQNTGGSATSSQGPAVSSFPQPPQQQARSLQPAGMDDLLGEDETSAVESSKITNDTTELANMSNQIGNLRNQMETTQVKKATTQADLNATAARKKDLEIRLQQFRAQYEQEVRAVKDLEQQLAASRDSTKKMDQELALLEGTYQDLNTQHQTVFQALQADQAENANLKQRIDQLNADISKLKPELEKARMDARQQKGRVSIQKKQLSTNESEFGRLQSEKADLEREAREAAASPPPPEPVPASREVTSPALSTLSATNPFARMTSGDASRTTSPAAVMSGAPTPSAFDQLFGPSFAQPGSRSATPPATSFGGRPAPIAAAVAPNFPESVSSEGRSTPSMTPPPFGDATRELPSVDEAPPPPPESRQFTPTSLPFGGLRPSAESDAGSTQVLPPASRAGGTETPRELETPGVMSPGELAETIPGGFPGHEGPFTGNTEVEPVLGVFPDEHAQPQIAAKEISGPSTSTATPSTAPTAGKDDFDSAFAGFGNDEPSASSSDPFAAASNENSKPLPKGPSSEFPPIQNLALEDESDSDSDYDDDSDKGFGDNFTAATPAKQNGSAPVEADTIGQASPPVSSDEITPARPEVVSMPSTASALPAATDVQSPPSYEESDKQVHGGNGERSSSNQFPPEFGGLLPAREDPTTAPAPALAPPTRSDTDRSLQTPQTSLFPNIGTPASATGTEFHDAYSRPVSSVPDFAAAPSQAQTTATPFAKDEFDEFDDFDDLAEAKEADKSGSDADFGFGNHSRDTSEFNGAFDSPAASMTTTMADSQQTPKQVSESNGFSGFSPSASVSGPVGGAASPQNTNHDWDAIFSGLDNSAAGNIDTSFGGSTSNDPWDTNGAQAATHREVQQPASPVSTTTAKQLSPAPAPLAPAITPGEEHDDPILKRLTGMGYTRGEALGALEKYDYDINRVSSRSI